MNPFDLLPYFPWEGPPLPRATGLTWASLMGQAPGQFPIPQIPNFFTGPESALSNDEVEEVERDERGFIIRRRISRHVRRD